MRRLGFALALAACAAFGCGDGDELPSDELSLEVPPDFPDLPAPEDNELTAARVALGRRLFYDARLSRDESIACASCHDQRHAFADPRRLSEGVDGFTGARNAPALFNLAYAPSLFWDGGAPTLELQAIDPIRNPVEMDSSLAAVNERLASDPSLVRAFRGAYGEGPDDSTLPRALASFVRSLISGNSPYDRFHRGDPEALTRSARRGLLVFRSERGDCFHCHVGFNFTNQAFRNNGTRPDDPDLGRERLTGKASDRGKFRVPSLRNVAVTAPYMHDGSFATLEEVIEHYDRGGEGHPNTDPVLRPLGLDDQEKADLLAFLRSLTDDDFLDDPRLGPP